MGKMRADQVKAYFESEAVVEAYARAAGRVGLWRSEEKIFTRLFQKEDALLELGCGAGRIAIGLHELGYQHIMATDYAKAMVQRARHLAKVLEFRIPFRVANALQLEFEDGIFDGAIFGFNGLMQIPGSANREAALKEIHRVLRQGAWFALTTHDRERSDYPDFWAAEKVRWAEGRQSDQIEDFGDRAEVMDEGVHYMHVPSVDEMKALIESTGFRLEATVMRSELGEEPDEVLQFSDDCRFWIVQKT